MERVSTQPIDISDYIESAGEEAVEHLRRLAAPLRGLRVLHVNATPRGGGVAEILNSLAPLQQSLGLDSRWQAIVAEPAFFEVTKKMHNGMQGAPVTLSDEEKRTYCTWQKRIADQLPDDVDVMVIHDPQPLGVMQESDHRTHAHWIWRLHIDSSHPNPHVWSFLRPMLDGYDAAVFTMAQFAPPDVPADLVHIIAPAIDPLTIKNRPMPYGDALARLPAIGLDPGRPLTAQVARLDPWKDPNGVIDAYRKVRESVPGLQLAMLGVIEAQDDPEAMRMYDTVREHAGDDPDIHIYVDPKVIGQPEVAAVQLLSQVVFQKSLREGFGLSVAEAMWKATPVIGGRAGGIPLQLQDGVGGFLVDSVADAAERTEWLLTHPPAARSIAARGRQQVREHFLITRLLCDHLELYTDVLGHQALAEQVAADD
jgi:trehalose synthase